LPRPAQRATLPTKEATMPMQSYTGGCHCGRVRYEVTADLANSITCNCSRCQRLGWILTFTPADNFRLLKGEDALTDYQFNKHVVHHLFCSTCGIESFARAERPGGGKTVAVNVRCLDDVDLAALEPTPFDGRSK
jgi:hypothetical protein